MSQLETEKYFCVNNNNNNVYYFQSETCEVQIPSLDFVTHAGTLGGRFTTLEGLLTNIKEQVRNKDYLNSSKAVVLKTVKQSSIKC